MSEEETQCYICYDTPKIYNGLKLNIKTTRWGGKVIYTINMNGKLHGKYQYFNQHVTCEENFVNGMKHGLSCKWDKDGNMCETEYFVNGIGEGLHVVNCGIKCGNLVMIYNCIKGKFDGIQEEHRFDETTGKYYKSEITTYKDGKKHGDKIEYWPNGNIKSYSSYYHHKVIDTGKTFDVNEWCITNFRKEIFINILS